MENLAAYSLLALRLLMALALYAFLAWALSILWRDIRSQAAVQTRQRVPVIRISMLGAEDAKPLRFTSSEIVIGRHPSCEWQLNHETVSSRHARLHYHHDQWWLYDLDSRNGTFLNGERIEDAVVLTGGDTVLCGHAGFTIQLEAANEGAENA